MLSFVCDYSEGAHPRILERLESVYTPKGYPEFESRSFRSFFDELALLSRLFLALFWLFLALFGSLDLALLIWLFLWFQNSQLYRISCREGLPIKGLTLNRFRAFPYPHVLREKVISH